MIDREKVIEVLKGIYDPEIPINIWDLGLVYKLDINENNDIYILMTLTFAGCPIGSYLINKVEEELKKIENVNNVKVELTFDPPWTPDRINEEVKKELGI
ncbi:MAG: iron-sulfur cluster assembly protein [Caldisericia bacterium]|jgi:metal-sulfur cluster biosynthetic enzyme|nr:iron-sulfur cluster assembly protein [Caldisericia bacterium]